MSQDSHTVPAEFFMTCWFDDSEAFAEAARGWNLDFTQLERGAFLSRMGTLVTSDVMLTECSLSRRTEQHGEPPPGYITFAFPMNDEMEVRWRGRTYSGEGFMLFRPNGDLDSISDSRFHVLTAAISETLLLTVAEQRGVDLERSLLRGVDVFAYSDELRFRVRSLLRRLMDAPSREPGLLLNHGYRESLEYELVNLILEALEEACSMKTRDMARERKRVLRSALSLIEERSDEPIPISEIERSIGASTRTLRNAFQEAYGISPKQYMQTYRLNRVQRRLRELRGEENAVSTAANEWGFWHMGQFAADYRRMFGELPSETLAK